jgi:flagella basal body P-ring formation protein FlgA
MKTRQLLLILLTAVVLCRPCPGASIGVPSQAVVAGSQVTLADLHATVLASPVNTAKIKAIVVAAAPLPGKSRTITKAQIREHLLQAGFNPDLIKLDCPEEIQITRSSNTIAGQEVIAAGADYLRRQITVEKDYELMISPISAPRNIVVPVGKIDLAAETTGTVSGKSSAGVRVSILLDGRPLQYAIVQYRLQLMGEVLVASHEIARNTVLTSADMKLERRDLYSIKGSALSDAAELTGRRVTRMLAAGTPLTDACTEPTPMVKKGQEVTVTVLASSIEVTASGIALQDGAKGEMIRIRNLQNKEEFQAKVVNETNVVIELTSKERPLQ